MSKRYPKDSTYKPHFKPKDTRKDPPGIRSREPLEPILESDRDSDSGIIEFDREEESVSPNVQVDRIEMVEAKVEMAKE